MAKTKIVVIQLKEIIYTVIFAALGILLILLLIFMFRGGKDKDVASNDTDLYTPGVYNSSITLNDTSFDMKVVVDSNHINSVTIQNIDDAVTTFYPLIDPSLEAIKKQLYNDVPIDEIQINEDRQYTEQLLIEAIESALDKAKIDNDKPKTDKDKLKSDNDKSKTDKDKLKTDNDKTKTDKDKLKTDNDKTKTDKDKKEN